MLSEPNLNLWTFVIFTISVVVIAVGMLLLSYFLGEKEKHKTTGEPYEGGIPPTGSARLRFSSSFYLIAMFFVIFDLDAAFIMIWAVSFREIGVAGYIGISIFIGILLILFLYELSTGALDFGPNGKKILRYKNKFEKENKK